MLGATPAGVHCCDSDMAITIDGMTYTGVFAVLPRETDGRATLTFSAIGGNQAIWGARIEAETPFSVPFPLTDIQPISVSESAVCPLGRMRGMVGLGGVCVGGGGKRRVVTSLYICYIASM